MDGVLKLCRKDFTPQLGDFSQQLVEYAKKMAQESSARKVSRRFTGRALLHGDLPKHPPAGRQRATTLGL
jgi:hypothetical protein